MYFGNMVTNMRLDKKHLDTVYKEPGYLNGRVAVYVNKSKHVDIKVNTIKQENRNTGSSNMIQQVLSRARVSQDKYIFQRENLIRRRPNNMSRMIMNKGSLIKFGAAVAILLITQGFVPITSISNGFQNNLISKAKAAVNDAYQAEALIKSQKFNDAAVKFKDASTKFDECLTSVKDTGQASSVLPLLSTNDTYSAAQAIIYAAKDLSDVGYQSSVIADKLFTSISKLDDSKETDPLKKASVITASLVSQENELTNTIKNINELLNHAQWIMNSYANKPLPNMELEIARKMLSNKLPEYVKISAIAQNIISALPDILGQDRNRRYMVQFLNNSELRPSGGFLGSFATTILSKGQIDAFKVETNIYKLDNAFGKIKTVEAPYPVSHFGTGWFLRDSNWSVDYAAAAKQVAWFYKQESGTDIDGVMSIDTTFMEAMLDMTGPIEVPIQHVTVDSKNFVAVAEYKSEREYLTNPEVNALNEPKKFLADMFPIFLQRIVEKLKKDPQLFMDTFTKMFNQKHVLFSTFFDAGNSFTNIVKSDNPFPTSGNFIMINNANLGGYKSSLNVKENVSIELQPTSDNKTTHIITITRTHKGTLEWPDGNNHNYVRIVAPPNAEFVESTSNGQEDNIVESTSKIEKYERYATFGMWLTTPAGETRTATFKYNLPNDTAYDNNAYKLTYIKQPGVISEDVTILPKSSNNIEFATVNKINQAVSTNFNWIIPLK